VKRQKFIHEFTGVLV